MFRFRRSVKHSMRQPASAPKFALETFSRQPGSAYRAVARAETPPRGPLAPVDWRDGAIVLCANGSGQISNIPQSVWDFAVSGYRVLPRWLAAREGMEIGPNFIPELRDVVARIAELLFHFEAADTILERTLADSLTRAALGMEAQDEEEHEDRD